MVVCYCDVRIVATFLLVFGGVLAVLVVVVVAIAGLLVAVIWTFESGCWSAVAASCSSDLSKLVVIVAATGLRHYF